MGKKLKCTPRSRIRQSLRQLWLRSRERAEALRRDEYKCQFCGVKQSKAKGKEVNVVVHHIDEINNWDKVIDIIYKEILCNPDKLKTLCNDCHDEIHNEKIKKN